MDIWIYGYMNMWIFDFIGSSLFIKMRDNSAQIASGKQLVFNQGLPASIDLNAEQHIYFL